ncbi:hypothetical protein BT63DRAFT_439609 [Microthyrium microscopicum]|uniref:Alcohol acetyltransferase n=1 Tax=Microthyrium microscopicum TaxID=703497 RepID=A0A6A6UIB7_9PEZI|nr:hypothetical protein BT63DRAFT_439609 [Microthyrium microscopicum]
MAKSLHDLPALRPLGKLEQYSASRHILNFYNNVGVSATYENLLQDISQDSLRSHIYSACHEAIRTHPALSAVPIAPPNKSSELYFARLDKIELDNCVLFQERKAPRPQYGQDEEDVIMDPELDDLIATQHNVSWRLQIEAGDLSPVWRLVVLFNPTTSTDSSFTACFIFHHSIGDGTSGVAFHRTLLRGLRSSIELPVKDIKSVVETPKDARLHPCVEDSLSLSLSLGYIAGPLIDNTLPWIFSTKSALWAGGNIVDEPKSQFRSMTFSAAASKKLVAACKKNRTTVSALLQAALADVLFKLLPEQFQSLKSSCPVSLRPLLREKGIDNGTFGVYIGAADVEFQRSELAVPPEGLSPAFALIRVSQRVREELVRFVAKGAKNLSIGLLKYVSDLNSFFTSKLGTARDTSFEVSNLGVVKEDPEHMSAMVFSQSANVTGAAFCVSSVTSGDGRLVLGFSWQEGVVEEVLVNDVIRELPKIFAHFCD